ncbi:lysylphosphatidylglycerol synthase transmembrane domain-containing protein [Variovorax humicola]|uniref:Lysylphosphatidylglycerol synthase transmembrane domain-containing protein n=1 Tax=Variovorax humicola TaxID=1769758 RepID=A0ABU8W3Q4_9BURK
MRVFRSAWFRISLALLVIAGLVQFNRINLATFAALGDRWPWVVAAFAVMLPSYAIVSIRFWIVLRNQGMNVPFKLALRWTMIGAFFDLAMPSNSGGDIIKGAYVVRHAGVGMRTRGIMAVAFDRVLGLIGLFLLASIAIVAGWHYVRQIPGGNKLLILLPLATAGALMFFRVLGARRLYNNRRFEEAVMRMPGGARLHGVIGSFNSLRERPAEFFAVLALSVLNHVCWCVALLCITRAFGLSVGVVQGFAVFPLAIFGNTFGFAGGFGIGTAAFDLVFSSLLHVSVGAAVGLTFQVLGAMSRLAGLPFYIHHPRQSTEAEPLTRSQT